MKIAAVVLIVLGLVGFGATAFGSSSVRGFVKDTYERAGSEDGVDRYRSKKPPLEVAKEIVDAQKPADRRVTPEGVFLRYRNDYVGVEPDGGGSKILVADEKRGYGLFFPYVGGFWGRASGRGEGFRGGGPGGGGK